jgi:hypothetical protein
VLQLCRIDWRCKFHTPSQVIFINIKLRLYLTIQGAYKLSDYLTTPVTRSHSLWLLPVGFREGKYLGPTTSKDITRIAIVHQHRNRERYTRHAWEGLAGMGVSPGHLPCHTWGAHRIHLRSLWNCKHSSFKW